MTGCAFSRHLQRQKKFLFQSRQSKFEVYKFWASCVCWISYFVWNDQTWKWSIWAPHASSIIEIFLIFKWQNMLGLSNMATEFSQQCSRRENSGESVEINLNLDHLTCRLKPINSSGSSFSLLSVSDDPSDFSSTTCSDSSWWVEGKGDFPSSSDIRLSVDVKFKQSASRLYSPSNFASIPSLLKERQLESDYREFTMFTNKNDFARLVFKSDWMDGSCQVNTRRYILLKSYSLISSAIKLTL